MKIYKNSRNDPIRTRGDLLKKYRLTEDDLKQIEDFLIKKVSVRPTLIKFGPTGLCQLTLTQ